MTNYQSVPVPTHRWCEAFAWAARKSLPLLGAGALVAFAVSAWQGFGGEIGSPALPASVFLAAAMLAAMNFDLWTGVLTERTTAATLRGAGVPEEVASMVAPLLRASSRADGERLTEVVADGYRVTARVAEPMSAVPRVGVTWGWA